MSGSANGPRTAPLTISKTMKIAPGHFPGQKDKSSAGLPQGGLNIAHEALEGHVLAGRGAKLALREERGNPMAELRDALGTGSMDFLDFVEAIHRRLGVDIPEIDDPKLSTLDSAVTISRRGSGDTSGQKNLYNVIPTGSCRGGESFGEHSRCASHGAAER